MRISPCYVNARAFIGLYHFDFQLMEDICSMGHNPNIVCSRSAVKAKTPASNQSQATNGDDTSSDDEDEEDEVPTSVREQESKMVTPVQPQ